MGFLSRLIGAEEKHNELALQGTGLMRRATRHGIAYDAELVNKLKNDHRELVRLLAAIRTCAKERHFGHLPLLLSNLESALHAHIMLENVKFYVYVQQYIPQDSDTGVLIADMRNEMDDIERTVLRFVIRHSSTRLAQDTLADFNAELEQIGALVTQRLRLEDSRLYPLYVPRHH